MAVCKDWSFFEHSNSSAFDTIFSAGSFTPYSGIYRCEGCGQNSVSTEGMPLPARGHHGHQSSQGTVRWRLIASTQ
jgi:hypothetical protein